VVVLDVLQMFFNQQILTKRNLRKTLLLIIIPTFSIEMLSKTRNSSVSNRYFLFVYTLAINEDNPRVAILAINPPKIAERISCLLLIN